MSMGCGFKEGGILGVSIASGVLLLSEVGG